MSAGASGSGKGGKGKRRLSNSTTPPAPDASRSRRASSTVLPPNDLVPGSAAFAIAAAAATSTGNDVADEGSSGSGRANVAAAGIGGVSGQPRQQEEFQPRVQAGGSAPPPLAAVPAPTHPLCPQLYAGLHPHFQNFFTPHQELFLLQQQQSSQYQMAAASATLSQLQNQRQSTLNTAAHLAMEIQMQMAQQAMIQQQFFQGAFQRCLLQQQLLRSMQAVATPGTAISQDPFSAQPTQQISSNSNQPTAPQASHLDPNNDGMHWNLCIGPRSLQSIHQTDEMIQQQIYKRAIEQQNLQQQQLSQSMQTEATSGTAPSPDTLPVHSMQQISSNGETVLQASHLNPNNDSMHWNLHSGPGALQSIHQINEMTQQQIYERAIRQQNLQQQQLSQLMQAIAASETETSQDTLPVQPTQQISSNQSTALQAPQQLLQSMQAVATHETTTSQDPSSTQPTQQISSNQQTRLQAPHLDPSNNSTHWNLHIGTKALQSIHDADESLNFQIQPGGPENLLDLLEDHRWVAALRRMLTHPPEIYQVGIQGRLPLHVACDHDAPPALVEAILKAWPEAALRVGTSHMNPLHIACSSPRAMVDVIRALLEGCGSLVEITEAMDVDGDTALHAAARFAAPMDVLTTLLQANPVTVLWKDYEGLNPVTRLWVRYFVLLGEQTISNIKTPEDLNDDLMDAWEKSLLLLRAMNAMYRRPGRRHNPRWGWLTESSFDIVHAAALLDCPRCIVRIATVLLPLELLKRDKENRLPLHIAAAAPIYAVHDLTGEGYTIEDANSTFDSPEERIARFKAKVCRYKEPSVINLLLENAPAAASERNEHGQLPLHAAIMRGKTLDEGVQALVNAYPDALASPDKQTNLYPFMLAASVGRGKGDCSTIYALLRAAPELVHMAVGDRDMEDGENREELEQLELPK